MGKTFTRKRLASEKKAKRRIIQVLRQHGAKVLDSKISDIASLKSVDSETKKVFKEFLGSKFDLFITRNGEHYVAECKYKSKEFFRNWVNVVEYDAYYKIASLPFPFLYFIWVEETDKIYRHEVVNPKDFERRTDRDGKPLYLIPQDLIHEIKPSWVKPMNVWFQWKSKDIEEWFKRTSKDRDGAP